MKFSRKQYLLTGIILLLTGIQDSSSNSKNREQPGGQFLPAVSKNQDTVSPQLVMVSVNRPVLLRLKNAKGIQLTLEISGEKAFVDHAANGTRFFSGIVTLDLMRRQEPSAVATSWSLY